MAWRRLRRGSRDRLRLTRSSWRGPDHRYALKCRVRGPDGRIRRLRAATGPSPDAARSVLDRELVKLGLEDKAATLKSEQKRPIFDRWRRQPIWWGGEDLESPGRDKTQSIRNQSVRDAAVVIGSFLLALILAAPGYYLAIVAIVGDNRQLLGWVFFGAIMIASITFLIFADLDISEVGFYTGLAYGLLTLALFVYLMGQAVFEFVKLIWGLVH